MSRVRGKSKAKSFVLFSKFIVTFHISRPKTTWWDNDWSPKGKDLRCRTEHLISIERVYFRTVKFYGYKIIVGRLCIGLGKL